jgi:pimeloyl-ACP methyl ester carboxylesterase
VTTFVLVHPAWVGRWCWRKLVPLLRVHGHEVHMPTLTGLGERAHLAHPGNDLHVHITDIVNVLVYEDLHSVVLLGTSSAGMVITGVAEQAPERIGHLVYLHAFVPDDGQCLLDLVPPDRRAAMEAQVESEGDGWLLPRFDAAPWDQFVPQAWQVIDRPTWPGCWPGCAPPRSASSRRRSGSATRRPGSFPGPTSAAPAGHTPGSTDTRRPRNKPPGGGSTNSTAPTCPTSPATKNSRPCCQNVSTGDRWLINGAEFWSLARSAYGEKSDWDVPTSGLILPLGVVECAARHRSSVAVARRSNAVAGFMPRRAPDDDSLVSVTAGSAQKSAAGQDPRFSGDTADEVEFSCRSPGIGQRHRRPDAHLLKIQHDYDRAHHRS